MIVYVEWVLFDNFCLDCLIGYLSLRFTKGKIASFKIVLSALVGCLLALLSPKVTKFVILYKFAVLFINTALLYLKKSIRGYFILTFIYAVLSFVLSGILTCIMSGKLAYSFVGVKKGGVIGIMSIGCFLLLYVSRQVRGLIGEKKRHQKYAVAELISGDRSVRLNALYDSGNLLTDRNGEEVVVLDEKAVMPLGELVSFGEMKIETISGNKILKLVKIPLIKIYSDGVENTLNNVTVALSDLPKEYAVILPD